MQNFKFLIEYNGAQFSGSQIQNGSQSARTVQGEFNQAISRFFKLDSVESVFASRTDAGVHALGQVANLRLPSDIRELVQSNPDKLLISLNSFLPSDISISSVEAVDDNFHARYSARSKLYSYKIFNRRHRPVLRLDSLLWVKEPLDWEAMSRYAASFVGTRDFGAYSSDDDSQNQICQISRSELIQESSCCFKYYIEGDRFLRYMVRRIVGDIINHGSSSFLESPIYTALPEGLTLVKVGIESQPLIEQCKINFSFTE